MALNILATFLGILFQIITKMMKTQNLYEISNEPFVYFKFFKKEGLSISLSIVSAAILFILFPEIVNYKPFIGEWQRLFFTMSGAMGSWILSQIFGKSRKYITSVIDAKTNVADGIQPSSGTNLPYSSPNDSTSKN